MENKSTEQGRVGAALGCGTAYCVSVLHNNHKSITLGVLRSMLDACGEKGFSDDTPMYVDDGTTVRPMYDEIHPYKSGCGEKTGIVLIADDQKEPTSYDVA